MSELTSRDRVSLFLLTLVSSVLYLSGLGVIFFLFPLEWWIRTRGRERFFVLVTVIGVTIAIARLAQGTAVLWILAELCIVLLLCGALYTIHYPVLHNLRSVRSIYRVLVVTGIFAITTYPSMSAYLQNSELIHAIATHVQSLIAEQPDLIIADVDITRIIYGAFTLALSSYIALFFLLVITGWVVGEVVFSHIPTVRHRAGNIPQKARFNISMFAIHQRTVWVLILCLLFSILFRRLWMPIVPIFINMLLLIAILYFLQGVAITVSIVMQKIQQQYIERFLFPTLILIAIIPIINGIIYGGLILVGISEVWIKYHRRIIS